MRRLLVAIGLVVSFAPSAYAAPDTDVWERWQAHDADSEATIDHSAFTAFLNKYVVVHDEGPNGVRYDEVSAADRDKLENYIESMEQIEIDDYSRPVQRAYWIDLYNAETIDIVLEHYPVASMDDIGGGWFHHGPWDDHVLEVEDEKLTLNDIEHRILRPIWDDELTLYGLSRAAMSAPSLRPRAYTGADVHQALVDNAQKYVNSPEGLRFVDDSQVVASKLYDWYQADFGGDTLGVIQHLREYAAPALSARLDVAHRIDGYAYDRSLNSERQIQDHGFSPQKDD
ncbi:DUF547 domain-containing protein [Salinisphaera sp. SPP-AMP-43]|uniref:DUF547 domain-containing protein n=1 Tax=Salinisphaera sp. SPP-AMP-43 TaxID=3121288 RepID=UPI003C6DE0A0